MEPLDFQRQAVDEIVSRARVFFAGQWRGLFIRPKFHSLMVGGTGVGKTTCSNIIARSVRANPLWITASGWMPAGANNRGTRETISVIAEAVAKNARTLLVIDEIDKIYQKDNSWMGYIIGEIYAIADGIWPTGLNEPGDDDNEITIEKLTEKLRETVFILGIGTFQSWFDEANTRRTIGFSSETDKMPDEITTDIITRKLPRELVNRFHENLVRLPELGPTDYHRIAHEAESKLPERMRAPFKEEVNRRIPGAIATKKGVRFLEEAVMEVLKNLPPEPVFNPSVPFTIDDH